MITDTQRTFEAGSRQCAVENLERAIVELGMCWRGLQAADASLAKMVGGDVSRYLGGPIVIAVNAAGLGVFLERKLQQDGAPVSLVDLVKKQHEELGLE